MVLPLAAAVPWIASAVGSMLPMIVDSFRSGKSPEEAQKQIAPQRQAMVERLIGSGMNMQQAEAMTDEAMADELAKAQLPEPMNPWLTAALAIGGGIGGYKLGAKFAGKGAPAPDVSKEAKIDTPAEQAIAKPASGQAPSIQPKPDMVSPDELAPVQMQAEARSRMQPSALDIRNTRMLNGVPAPQRDKVLSPDELDAMISRVERKPMDSPFPAKPMSASDEIAAKLDARSGYDTKLRSLDNTDQSLISAVDDMVPASRPQGPFPEFMPGEFQSKTPSASLRPWESMPEVEGAMIRKQLGKRKADPRGIVNFMPPEGGPFPSPEAARAYSSMYRYEGG